jgi:hypothetical protein
MWEQVLIFIIVILAALYVIRGLRRAATGKTACQQDYCTGCPYGGGCDRRKAEPSSKQHNVDETESDT